MSGLYNMILGHHPLAGDLLGMLAIDPRNVPRFRDCVLHADSIRIMTRTGGGNREVYAEQNAEMAKHPLLHPR